MRTSKDIYRLKNGDLVAIDQVTEPPEGSHLYTGYNYDLQEWWFRGEKDTRSFDEISNTIAEAVKLARSRKQLSKNYENTKRLQT